ncbi:SRPBCC family protein [Phytomonospora sp. NPDC050363]|uniref:SRPBCC family protein n=1 Tax=Phytomonospora sp. NPDC050363 TaxID=3155642 RepID=UPI0033E4EAD3
MTDSSTQSIGVSASPGQVAAVILDFAAYPEWAASIKSSEVRETDDQDRPALVGFVLDAGVLKDEYELRYDYTEDLGRISWTLAAPSALQKSQQGSYEITGNADGTSTVTYTLAIDLSMPMLGMFRRKAEKMIMDTALKELKRRVESRG